MSKRTICTCDLCGKDTEPVFPIKLGFGERCLPNWITNPPIIIQTEMLTGDACNPCMRKLIEDLRSKYCLKYEVN